MLKILGGHAPWAPPGYACSVLHANCKRVCWVPVWIAVMESRYLNLRPVSTVL